MLGLKAKINAMKPVTTQITSVRAIVDRKMKQLTAIRTDRKLIHEKAQQELQVLAQAEAELCSDIAAKQNQLKEVYATQSGSEQLPNMLDPKDASLDGNQATHEMRQGAMPMPDFDA